MSEDVSEIVVDQRIRNQIMGYWSWVSSFDEQRSYQAAAPYISVAKEVFNQWGDWVHERWINDDLGPVYSPEEQQTLRAYHAMLKQASADTPDILPPLEQMIGTEVWERIRLAAEASLAVFQKRGYFDHEVAQFS